MDAIFLWEVKLKNDYTNGNHFFLVAGRGFEPLTSWL